MSTTAEKLKKLGDLCCEELWWLCRLYLMYVDESGKPDRSHQSDFFVQAAFILNERKWQAVNNMITGLKTKWFPNLSPSDIEIHAYDITNQNGPFKALGRHDSLKFFDDIFDLIGQVECTLVATVVHKRKCYAHVDIEEWSHRLLFERLCKYLEKMNVRLLMANQPPEHGIILMDSINDKYDNMVRGKYRSFLTRGTYYLNNEYLIEDPLFVRSCHRNMTQLADNVAYCVRRYVEAQGGQGAPSNVIVQTVIRGYTAIEKRFDTGSTGAIEGCGIKHFPS